MTFNNSKFNKLGFNVSKAESELLKAATNRILSKQKSLNNATQRILKEEKIFYATTERFLLSLIQNNNVAERFLLSLIQNNNVAERFLFEERSITNTTLRGIGDPFSYIWPTSRILPESNQLCWTDSRPKEQLFSIDQWAKTEKSFEQFSLGEHLLTKAFEDDYLALIDDYNMAWGPSELGDPLGEYEAVYTSRVYIVYTTEAGENNLATSDIGGNEIEKIEPLTYVPSGSQFPSIAFNSNGRYEISVEIKPAGGTKEVWMFSYPYEGDDIREICPGMKPEVTLDHKGNVVIFYQPNTDSTTIKYRSSDNGYSTEYDLAEFNSEKEIEVVNTKIFKSDEKDINYLVNLILFAYRYDDIEPYKYIAVSDMKTKPQQFKDSPGKLTASLEGINWIEIVEKTESLTDSPGKLTASLEGINWIEIVKKTKSLTDNPSQLSVSLTGINWQEITSKSEMLTDSPNQLSVSLEEILWVQP